MECLNVVPLLRRRPTGFSAGFLLLLLAFIFLAPRGHARVELQPCKNSIAPDQQIALGQKAVAQVYQQMPVLPDSSPVSKYVSALGLKIAAQAPGYRWPYNFHVVNVADINAFAVPGGSIFVNLGTVQAASNEAQLAAVLGHEISHVVLQHSVCNMEKENRVGLFAGLGQIATGLLLGDSTLGAIAQKGIGLTAGLSFLRMSRDAEQQADLEGVGILYDTNYDPRAMPQFFETIQAKYGKGGAQLLSDHPNPGNRTEYVGREISTLPPKSRYITSAKDFNQARKSIGSMHVYTSKEVDSGAWKSKDPNQPLTSAASPTDPNAPSASGVDTTSPQQWTAFQGTGFSMLVPSGWQANGNQNAAMLAPQGGITATADGKGANLVYGVLTDVYRPDKPAGNSETFTALLAELTRGNPGLAPGQVGRVNVGSTTADAVHSLNRSANNGRGEHDWIVGVPQSGSMRYFVFVSPEPDFNTMRPTFERILNSIRLE